MNMRQRSSGNFQTTLITDFQFNLRLLDSTNKKVIFTIEIYGNYLHYPRHNNLPHLIYYFYKI